MGSTSIEWRVAGGPRQALSAFRAAEGPTIEKRGYRIDDQGPQSLTYKRKMTIPPERFTVSAAASDGGSVITVEGKVHRKLRKSFAALAEQPQAALEPEIEELDSEVEELDSEGEELEIDREEELEIDGEELEIEEEEEEAEPVVELAAPQRNGAPPEPASPEAEQSSLLREVRSSPLLAEGASRRLDAEANGEEIDCSEMRAELERVYHLAGHPEAFAEALGKVQDLAGDLVLHAGCAPNEALYIAYRRSLVEHHEYLAARGISDPVAS